eukprot:TRINITY_DN1172_c0_g1_i1.p1 TRINITY_DN1172_c0_g1~~TRINITY_DN1172_c0_g1_i1.p1  ORF type:complete len:190 (-),score=37.29 TRINITY_DN1172_c0_g1_i1:143-712(-)
MFLFLFLFATTISLSQQEVHHLTGQNFAEKTSEGAWLVEFYAPWCGHCQRLTQTWKDLAAKAEQENLPFKVADVEATTEVELASAFEISSFPTIKFLKDGKVYEYKGPRTIEGFTEFSVGRYSSVGSTDLPIITEKQQSDNVAGYFVKILKERIYGFTFLSIIGFLVGVLLAMIVLLIWSFIMDSPRRQ